MLKIYGITTFLMRGLLLAIIILLIFIGFRSLSGSRLFHCNGKTIIFPRSDVLAYHNMNHLSEDKNGGNQAHVLILTPLKEAAHHLDRYFANINRLSYPHHHISLGFLVSDSLDNTPQRLQDHARWFKETQQDPSQYFHSVRILQKDFNFILSNDDRHNYEVQVKRREIMARSRNYLLATMMHEKVSWVLWLDGDVIDYPDSLLEDLISLDQDVVVPNCLWRTYNEHGGYDLNNWQETNKSLALQATIADDIVLMEGYHERETYRQQMINMVPENEDLFYMIPLDGVGGTCTLVRAEVHRQGVHFPPYVYKHAIETEGFSKMAKAMGFNVFGLPNYFVYHYIP